MKDDFTRERGQELLDEAREKHKGVGSKRIVEAEKVE